MCLQCATYVSINDVSAVATRSKYLDQVVAGVTHNDVPPAVSRHPDGHEEGLRAVTIMSYLRQELCAHCSNTHPLNGLGPHWVRATPHGNNICPIG